MNDASAVLGRYASRATVTARSDAKSFTSFVERVGRPLHQALIAAYGVQVGEDATADALAYAWEHWESVQVMRNPGGYLYRVGQSKARRGIFRKAPPVSAVQPVPSSEWYEPGLAAALARLPKRQRAAVVLVHGFGWTMADVARMWGVSFSTVKSHVDKGMGRLRDNLGVEV